MKYFNTKPLNQVSQDDTTGKIERSWFSHVDFYIKFVGGARMGRYNILKYFKIFCLVLVITWNKHLSEEAVNAIPVPFPVFLWIGKKDLGRFKRFRRAQGSRPHGRGNLMWNTEVENSFWCVLLLSGQTSSVHPKSCQQSSSAHRPTDTWRRICMRRS